MKEELRQIFELKDPVEVCLRRMNRFDVAKQSQISTLAKFAFKKEKRFDELVACASYNISTSSLEGSNNKIKVAERLAYGFERL